MYKCLYINATLLNELAFLEIKKVVNITVQFSYDLPERQMLKMQYVGFYDNTYVIASPISIIRWGAPPDINLVYHGKTSNGIHNKKTPSKILRSLHKKGMTISKEDVLESIKVIRLALHVISNPDYKSGL